MELPGIKSIINLGSLLHLYLATESKACYLNRTPSPTPWSRNTALEHQYRHRKRTIPLILRRPCYTRLPRHLSRRRTNERGKLRKQNQRRTYLRGCAHGLRPQRVTTLLGCAVRDPCRPLRHGFHPLSHKQRRRPPNSRELRDVRGEGWGQGDGRGGSFAVSHHILHHW